MSKIVTRFPPSPTGELHIGRARTALFNFLYAKQNSGKLVFRLEDTDKERSRGEYEEDIVESLKWLGITYDEGPFRQSERTAIYIEYLNKMIERGHAYEAEDSEKGEGRVVRFKNPNKKISFTDIIRGEITFDTTELGDFVIARNKKEPIYHLAVVVDDFLMGVTHVIRGEDGISNTPRQILIGEAIGAPTPTYAHIPLILAPDKSKLSGRHGAVSVRAYKEMGYLPEAVVNYLSLLGWNPGDEREIFSMDELIKEFKLEKAQKGGAVFNIQKLNSINAHYIKELSDEEFVEKIMGGVPEDFPTEMFKKIVHLIKERVSNGQEAKDEAKALLFFVQKPSVDDSKLCWKDTNRQVTAKYLDDIIKLVAGIEENEFSAVSTKEAIWPYADEKGRGEVLWPMRYSLTGQEKSPDPFTVAGILGKAETLSRLESALQTLNPES